MIVHPSLMLVVSLDERRFSSECAADIRRAFAHLAPTMVRSHPAGESECNIITFKVNFSKAYWRTDEADAADMWSHVRDWLVSKEYFLAQNIANFNSSRSSRGAQTINYDRIDVVMAGNTFEIALPSPESFAPLADLIEQIHTRANDGTLQEALRESGTLHMQIPAPVSLDAQRKAYETILQESCRDTDQVPAMDLDYHIWAVIGPEGTARTFDASEGTWLEQ